MGRVDRRQITWAFSLVALIASACAQNDATAVDESDLRHCGNGVCSRRESCSTCPADCGRCPGSTDDAAVGAPAREGLVAYYAFEGADAALVADSSGNANNGTGRDVARVAGRVGSGLSFNGRSSVVTVPDAASLDLSRGMTLEAWVRPSSPTGWQTVVTKETSGNVVYGLFSSSDTSEVAGVVSFSPTQTIVRAPQLTANAWAHLATAFDGSTLSLYVNGDLASTVPAAGTILLSDGALRIGGNDVWPEWFAGIIDEVRVYNRALSRDEIRADMGAAGVPMPSSDAGTPGAVDAGSPPAADAGTAPIDASLPPPTGNVVEISGTVSSSVFLSRVSAAPAGALIVRPAGGAGSFTVTGDFTFTRANVTIQHGVFRAIDVAGSANGLVVEDSHLLAFNVDGADNWVLHERIAPSRDRRRHVG